MFATSSQKYTEKSNERITHEPQQRQVGVGERQIPLRTILIAGRGFSPIKTDRPFLATWTRKASGKAHTDEALPNLNLQVGTTEIYDAAVNSPFRQIALQAQYTIPICGRGNEENREQSRVEQRSRVWSSTAPFCKGDQIEDD